QRHKQATATCSHSPCPARTPAFALARCKQAIPLPSSAHPRAFGTPVSGADRYKPTTRLLSWLRLRIFVVRVKPVGGLSRSLTRVVTFRPQSQQGEQFHELDKALRLLSFRRGQRRALVLAVEQFLQPRPDPGRQSELRQVLRHLQFDGNGVRHGSTVMRE